MAISYKNSVFNEGIVEASNLSGVALPTDIKFNKSMEADLMFQYLMTAKLDMTGESQLFSNNNDLFTNTYINLLNDSTDVPTLSTGLVYNTTGKNIWWGTDGTSTAGTVTFPKVAPSYRTGTLNTNNPFDADTTGTTVVTKADVYMVGSFNYTSGRNLNHLKASIQCFDVSDNLLETIGTTTAYHKTGASSQYAYIKAQEVTLSSNSDFENNVKLVVNMNRDSSSTGFPNAYWRLHAVAMKLY